MRKILYFLFFLELLVLNFLLSIFYVQAQSAVGIGVQIIDTSGPFINLITPINNSGSIDRNITFFYNTSDASAVSNCSLIINDKINITNDSITKDTKLSLKLNLFSLGHYNWSINCTDSLGNVGESSKRAFSVNFFIFFNTTINLSAVDIRNVTNFTIEKPDFGIINFTEGLDLSQGLDIDKYVNISFNRIEINSTALPSLNKSATLQIVGLTFSNPRILIDGDVCLSDVCKKVSYSNGVLIFNVTHFTAYSSEETPSESGSSRGGGTSSSSGGGSAGGGGGIPTVVNTDFAVDKTTLKIKLKQGETKKEVLSIKNTGTSIFDVKAVLKELEKFKISPEASEVVTSLNPDEEKTIEFVFKASENEKPDIYLGKITFKSPSVEKEIAAIVEVDSAQPLFDVDVDILPESKKIFPGQELLLDVNLFNIRGFGRVDVSVEYSIKDLNGNLLAAEHETLAVETQAKFTRSLLVPSDLKPGTYVAVAKVTYGDSVGTSSALFEVNAKTIKLYAIEIKDYRFILLLGGAAIFAVLFIFSARFAYLKKKFPKTKEEEIKQLQSDEKGQKLKKELEALEKAYKSGLISEESYQKSRKRVEEQLKKERYSKPQE